MQAKLEPSEFAYLLHTFEASKVVGVRNNQLFPNEPATRQALLNQGFTRLQANGWFVPTDGKIHSNNRLMLMAAVVASPDYTVMATYYATEGSYQTVTYYVAHKIVIEQFMDSEGDYLLTQLETAEKLIERLATLFGLETAVKWQNRLKFELTAFEQALSQAKSGDFHRLETLVLANEVPPSSVNDLIQAIWHLKPVGQIEGAVIIGPRLKAWDELAILQDHESVYWLVHKDDSLNVIELFPATSEQFEVLLEQLLQRLTS